MAKIGLIQIEYRMEYNIKARQDRLIELAAACFEEGADLVFFPEAFQYDGNRAVINDTVKFAEISAEWKERCAALAKKYHAYVVPWDYSAEDGKIYNLFLLLIVFKTIVSFKKKKKREPK